MLLRAFDINILSSYNVSSTYRCEMRDGEARTFFCERAPGTRIIYCETEEDAAYCERGRKRVYSYGANHYNFTDELPYKAVRQTVKYCPSMEMRIYNPQCPVTDDMLIIVSTRINGMYVQLYGGLYSECDKNSYEVIRHDNKIYCEYSAFYIPKDITGMMYSSITVTLVPVNVLEDHRYYSSDEYQLGSRSFTKEYKLNLKSQLVFRDEILCLTATTGVTRRDFEKQYKHFGISSSDSLQQILKDSYDVSLCLYEGDSFSEETLLYKTTYDSIIENTSLDAPLINRVFPILNTIPDASGIYANIDINMLGEKYYGTHKLDWSTAPSSMIGRVEITYKCVNAYGEELVLDFKSNPVPVIKDYLKYLIDKPAKKTLNEYFDDYNNYKKNHMLNVNIMSVCEDTQPRNTAITGNTPVIIQKPIFFKAQPSQQVTLQMNITQRVGINLQEYETKVSCFYIKIGSQQFPERERTDIYVIFKIDTSLLDGTETQYHVLDQDSELITSGKLILQ